MAEANTVPAKEVGVEDQVAELLRSGEMNDAREILNRNSVKYSMNRNRVDNQPSGQITPASHYSETDSELYCTLVHSEDNKWLATGNAILKGLEVSIRQAYMIDDACALVYDHDKWSSPNPTEDNLWLEAQQHSIEMEEYNPNYGVAATVEITANNYDEATIGMQTYLENEPDNNTIPVTFEYEHTFASTAGDIDVSISFGAMSVTLPVNPDAKTVWKDKQPAYPN